MKFENDHFLITVVRAPQRILPSIMSLFIAVATALSGIVGLAVGMRLRMLISIDCSRALLIR